MKAVYEFGDFQDSLASYGSYIRSGSSTGDLISRMQRSLRLATQSLLTQRQRECLDLYYDKCFTAEEIGEELGITKATVYKHLRTARRKLYCLMRLYK